MMLSKPSQCVKEACSAVAINHVWNGRKPGMNRKQPQSNPTK